MIIFLIWISQRHVQEYLRKSLTPETVGLTGESTKYQLGGLPHYLSRTLKSSITLLRKLETQVQQSKFAKSSSPEQIRTAVSRFLFSYEIQSLKSLALSWRLATRFGT